MNIYSHYFFYCISTVDTKLLPFPKHPWGLESIFLRCFFSPVPSILSLFSPSLAEALSVLGSHSRPSSSDLLPALCSHCTHMHCYVAALITQAMPRCTYCSVPLLHKELIWIRLCVLHLRICSTQSGLGHSRTKDK